MRKTSDSIQDNERRKTGMAKWQEIDAIQKPNQRWIFLKMPLLCLILKSILKTLMALPRAQTAKTRTALFDALMAENQAWVDAQIKEAERSKKKESAPVQAGQAFGFLGPYITALGEIGDAETAKQLEFFMESKDEVVPLSVESRGGELRRTHVKPPRT